MSGVYKEYPTWHTTHCCRLSYSGVRMHSRIHSIADTVLIIYSWHIAFSFVTHVGKNKMTDEKKCASYFRLCSRCQYIYIVIRLGVCSLLLNLLEDIFGIQPRNCAHNVLNSKWRYLAVSAVYCWCFICRFVYCLHGCFDSLSYTAIFN